MGKVVSVQALLGEIKNQNKKIVFTNGCFDILHVGHVRYLKEAKGLGELLVVGVNTDSSVKKLKGESRPVQQEKDRAEILASLGAVDYVVLFAEDTPLDLIEKIQPDVLVKGGDWAKKDIVGHEIVEAKGGQVMSLNFVDGHSTTSIVEKMSSN